MELHLTDAPMDRKGKASLEAAQGGYCLGVGDTLIAQRHYAEAARLLDAEAAGERNASERSFLRFLAASQHFHGGNYGQAQRMARRIEERLLPESVRRLFQPFVQDVKSRVSPDYPRSIRERLVDLRAKEKYQGALDLLKSHPYVLTRTQLCFARAMLCEDLKRYHAAAMFHAAAMRFDPDNPQLPYLAAAFPQWLASVQRIDEACSYVDYQLEEIASPVTDIAASIVRHRKASVSKGEEQMLILMEQVKYFERAWAQFDQMAAPLRSDPNLRELMSLCFQLAAFALWKLDEPDKSSSVLSEGIKFNPRYAGLYTIRGMMRSRTPEGRTDFEKAIVLGEQTYAPHYYLAQYAMEQKRFDEARTHIREAFRQDPGSEIRGQLKGWEAICRSFEKEPDIPGIHALFEQAVVLAPNIEEIRKNHACFLRQLEHKGSPAHADELHWLSIEPVDIRNTGFLERVVKEKFASRSLEFARTVSA